MSGFWGAFLGSVLARPLLRLARTFAVLLGVGLLLVLVLVFGWFVALPEVLRWLLVTALVVGVGARVAGSRSP